MEEIKDLPVEAVGGMDMGATPIVGAVAVMSHLRGRPLPVFVVRKEVKQHGTMKPIEGPLPAGGKVVLIDDVITTGGSILKAVDAVEGGWMPGADGHLCAGPQCRRGGNDGQTGIPYRPLVTLAISASRDRRG